MTTKTYGVYGFIEYEVTLNIGGKFVNAFFGGGCISQQGITPATYTTSNPVIQYSIEQLASFRKKRIVVVSEVKTEPETPQPEAQEPQPQPEEGQPAPIPEDGEVTLVEVTCVKDAQEYLQEHFSIPSYKVRSIAAIRAAGAEHGVEFTGFQQ